MKKTFNFLLVLLTFSFCLLTFATLINAQSTVDLTVSPPTQEINVKPGMQTRTQIKFFNRGADNIAGSIKIADFIVSDKDGSPDLLDTSSVNNRFAASSWLSLSEEKVNIAANSPYTSTVFINVPTDVKGCGHYAGIYFQPTPAGIGNKTGSSISFKLAGLIYFNVEGKCTEKAYLNKIEAPSFMEYGPIPVSIEVLNRSDYHVSPQGYINALNLFNRQTGVETLPKYNIFPDAIRKYDLQLGSKWMFGRYKIGFNAGYGKTGQAITGFTYTWVFPWRVVLVVILTIIFVILIISNLYKKVVVKESVLEEEIEKEKEEIEELKEQLRKKRD